MARFMVTHCGLSDVIGPMCISGDVSEALRQRVDAEVASMLLEARNTVKTMLMDKMQVRGLGCSFMDLKAAEIQVKDWSIS